MSIPTIPDAPDVQQFDLIPLRSMGDEEVFEAASNDFWPRVKPFAEDLMATNQWINTVYAAMGEAYQETSSAAQTATEKAGEAVQAATDASGYAQAAQDAIALLGEGAIVDGEPSETSAWPSLRTSNELAAKRDLDDTSLRRYDLASSTPTGATVTLDLSEQQVFRNAVTETRTFELSNVPASDKAMTVVLHLFDPDLPTRAINWPAGIIWGGGSAPEFLGTAAVVTLLWTGQEWLGSAGVDNA